MGYQYRGRGSGVTSTLREGLLGTLGDVSLLAPVVVVLLTVVSKMSASCCKAMSCSEASCLNGIAGD